MPICKANSRRTPALECALTTQARLNNAALLRCATLVRASVTQQAANSNRSSFSSDTSPVRPLKGILAVSSAYVVPSTIGLESNPEQ